MKPKTLAQMCLMRFSETLKSFDNFLSLVTLGLRSRIWYDDDQVGKLAHGVLLKRYICMNDSWEN